MNIPSYPVHSITPIQDTDYLHLILQNIDQAKSRIWASIFIIDAREDNDELRSVRSVIDRLAYATWRNVDVRVIVGAAKVEDLFLANRTSSLYMKKRGINVREYASPHRHSTHSKYMLFDDDLIVVGSDNWSHNAFNLAVNTAIAAKSPGLNTSLAKAFDTAWQTSKEISHENQTI